MGYAVSYESAMGESDTTMFPLGAVYSSTRIWKYLELLAADYYVVARDALLYQEIGTLISPPFSLERRQIPEQQGLLRWIDKCEI